VAPDLPDLAGILYLPAGITKRRKDPGGEIYFRAAACTGALYEIELYVVTGDLEGLDAGVFLRPARTRSTISDRSSSPTAPLPRFWHGTLGLLS
jgi:hypothetical protein